MKVWGRISEDNLKKAKSQYLCPQFLFFPLILAGRYWWAVCMHATCIQTPCTTVEENPISGVQLDTQNPRSQLDLYIIPYCSQQLQQCLLDICPGTTKVQHLQSHTLSIAQFKKKWTHYLSNWVLSGCCTMPSGFTGFLFSKLWSQHDTAILEDGYCTPDTIWSHFLPLIEKRKALQ